VTTGTKNGTILIVDDEEPVREPLYTELVREGYSCFEADRASKAVNRLKNNPVDLTILDIMMRDNSGIELLHRIIKNYPNTAVIIASHTVEPNIIIECMKSGVQDYITKPFNLEVVTSSIEKVLRKRQIELMLKAYQAGLEGKVAEQANQIRKLYLSAIDSLVTALEAKDAYTAGHSRRVNQLAYAISQHMGLTAEEVDDLCWGALLHDVGKIAIDPAIQNKPRKLTNKEYEQIMTHIQLGPRIVKAVANENIINIIKYHHTRYGADPKTQVVVGEEIPVGARIVTLADSFDAMTSDRPYRKRLSLEAALHEIKRCSGTQFDPVVVDVFLKIPESEILGIIKSDIDQIQA
jgi:response regulator RpfG family c-di-GMP phosphodiesterase